MKKEALLINVIGDAAFFHCDGKEFLTKRLRLHSTSGICDWCIPCAYWEKIAAYVELIF